MGKPSTSDAAAPATKAIPLRHVFAVSLGNALGFYDFLTFVYFSVYISNAFFPAGESPLVRLLATSGVSMLGFLARPVGALVIGPLGDRLGRRWAMMFSFVLMGIGVAGMGLTPSYARIGIAAPILVLLFRLIQGFALGGEVGPTTAYLVEAAPPNRRGFYAAMQYCTQDLGALAASGIGAVLALTMSEAALQDWGWRIAILLGAAIVPFGLWLRSGLPETLHAADDAALAPDATLGSVAPQPGIRPYLLIIGLGLVMLASGTIGSYTSSFMTPYAQTVLHFPAAVAFGAGVVNNAFSIPFEALSGWLSDRFGRKPVMLIPGILQLLAIYPCFWLITTYRTPIALYVAIAVVTTLQALSSTPVVVTLTEQIPKRVRSGVVATVYAVAISIFGGSTQLILTWLLIQTGNQMIPAYYWAISLVFGLTAMALVKESAPRRLSG
jgi:MFS transporter, MHS family, citrate/tricarballylate:H+ symporter